MCDFSYNSGMTGRTGSVSDKGERRGSLINGNCSHLHLRSQSAIVLKLSQLHKLIAAFQ